MSGTLYLCATPIGNLEDITLRVLRTLREVDLIAAEDTRTSWHLLSRYEITTKLTSYHKFNEKEKGQELTDAGTPAISDPGEILVRLCMENGIEVTSLPGANACITALTLSGQDTRRFAFEGFLPGDKKERKEVLAEMKTERRTMVLYEAPHRLVRTLETLREELGGGRSITLCRELTKKYETIDRTTIDQAIARAQTEPPRGEYVLVIEGKSDEEIREEKEELYENLPIPEHVARFEAQGMSRKDAMKAVAKERGLSRRDVYRMCLEE